MLVLHPCFAHGIGILFEWTKASLSHLVFPCLCFCCFMGDKLFIVVVQCAGLYCQNTNRAPQLCSKFTIAHYFPSVCAFKPTWTTLDTPALCHGFCCFIHRREDFGDPRPSSFMEILGARGLCQPNHWSCEAEGLHRSAYWNGVVQNADHSPGQERRLCWGLSRVMAILESWWDGYSQALPISHHIDSSADKSTSTSWATSSREWWWARKAACGSDVRPSKWSLSPRRWAHLHSATREELSHHQELAESHQKTEPGAKSPWWLWASSR